MISLHRKDCMFEERQELAMALIRTERVDQVAIIRFDDPTTLNAMSVPMVEEFQAALSDERIAFQVKKDVAN